MNALDLPSALLEAGAVRFSPRDPFTWASGLRAPVYCDNRRLLGHPALRAAITAALAARAAEETPTLVAGTATAGIPWATLVADRLELPMAYVRAEPKGHGLGRRVEGPPVGGHRVVLLEDLVSTGGSSVRCVEALRQEGAEVAAVLALFSYGLSRAEAAFREAGAPLAVLATFDDLLRAARGRGGLEAADLASLEAWRGDPADWSQRHG